MKYGRSKFSMTSCDVLRCNSSSRTLNMTSAVAADAGTASSSTAISATAANDKDLAYVILHTSLTGIAGLDRFVRGRQDRRFFLLFELLLDLQFGDEDARRRRGDRYP